MNFVSPGSTVKLVTPVCPQLVWLHFVVATRPVDFPFIIARRIKEYVLASLTQGSSNSCIEREINRDLYHRTMTTAAWWKRGIGWEYIFQKQWIHDVI